MRRLGGRPTLTRALLALGATILVLLVLAQLLLPRIAASTISSRIGRYGHVESVHVSAFPALELLWGSAESVDVHAGALALAPAQAGKLLWESRDVERMDVHAESVRVGPLRVSAATLIKRGSALTAEAQASEADVAAALPPGFSLRLLSSDAGQVEVQASGGLFGIGASVEAVALGSGGKLVAHPRGLLIEALQLTLFSDPHVFVEGVGAGQRGSDYTLSMYGHLH
jgi:hypothetical protein